jgi:hypothetical protein
MIRRFKGPSNLKLPKRIVRRNDFDSLGPIENSPGAKTHSERAEPNLLFDLPDGSFPFEHPAPVPARQEFRIPFDIRYHIEHFFRSEWDQPVVLENRHIYIIPNWRQRPWISVAVIRYDNSSILVNYPAEVLQTELFCIEYLHYPG